MEEKERYIIDKGEDISIVDNDRKVIFTITTKRLQDLLNYQDIHIKRFEEENQQLKQEVNDWKQRFEASEGRYKTLQENFVKVIDLKNDKIKQLKQSQKQLAIDKMTELHDLTDEIYHSNDMDKEWLLDWLKAEIWKLNQEIELLKEGE